MSAPLIVTTRFEPDQERTFQHVPFDVPEGVANLHIHIEYNDRIGSSPFLTGGNTLDIGVFDERGIESGSPGLRGWSGSERVDITIGEEWATPPYRAAEIGAGTWHLCLGAYKIGPNGLDVTATIAFDVDEERPDVPPVAELADLHRPTLPPTLPGWYRGDLHQHTVYSDGDSYPHEVAAIAYQTGLDFYGITDHNRAQSPVPLVPHGDGWPVLVPGVEVTTYAGHFNVWGTQSWYDFRNPTAEGLQAAVNHARADGGFVSLNHPRPYGPEWLYPEVTGFHAIEPWNGWWGRFNNMSIGYWADVLAHDTPDQWHVGICGSDCHENHNPGMLGNPVSEATMGYPTLFIQTDDELSAESVLDALRAGRCFVSEAPFGPQVYVDRSDVQISVRVIGAAGDGLLVIGTHGCVAASPVRDADQTLTWEVNDPAFRDEPFVRFELHAVTGGVRALTQPVWLRG